MGITKSERHERFFIAAGLSLALLFYAYFIHRTSFQIGDLRFYTLIDDGMISMRYARNLARGFGLVWNVGEAPVQGFTNPGWTLYMALLHKIPFAESKISLVVMLSGGLLLLGTAFLAYKLSAIVAPKSAFAPKIALIMTAFYYPLVFWSLRGMEVGVLTFLMMGTVVVALRPPEVWGAKKILLVGVLGALAIVVRFDVVLQLVVLLLYLVIDQSVIRKAGVSRSILTGLFFFAGVAGVLVFQKMYFGSLLPNTYYLKVDGVSFATRLNTGLQVLVDYSSRDFLFPLFIALAGLAVFRELRRKEIVLLLALFLVQCLYSVYVGGDYSEPLHGNGVDAANRFITQGMIFLIVAFSVAADRFLVCIKVAPENLPAFRSTFQASVNLALAIGLCALIIMNGEPWFEWMIYNAPGLRADAYNTRLGIHIRENTEEDAVIAVHAAGQIPYYSGRTTIDLLGKSDPVIAKGSPVPGAIFIPGHNKWDYQYSISTFSPDVIADMGALELFFTDNREYSLLDNGIWVRNDSERINFEGLAQSVE